MTTLRRATATFAIVPLALGGCATAPPASFPPQSLALSTVASAGPTLGWGSAPRALAPLPGAHCTLANDRGSWTAVTPAVLPVERSTAALRITCRKEGYRDASLELPCARPGTAAAVAFQAGLAFGGPLALILIPAGAIAGAMALAEGGREPQPCAYGEGREVQVPMEP